MKIFKYFFIVLFVIIVMIFMLLSSQSALDFVAKTALKQSGMNLRYDLLKGDIFTGLSLKGINYKDKVKADFSVKVDIPAFSKGVLYIEKIKAENIWIDEGFLQSLLDTNTGTGKEQEKTRHSDIPHAIIIDDFEFSLIDMKYQVYKVEKLDLHIKNFQYDMKEKIDADIDLILKSNIAVATGNVSLRQSQYNANFEIDTKKNFLNSVVAEQNLTIQSNPHLTANLRGDQSNTAFDVKLTDTKLRYQMYSVEPRLLTLKGHYDLKSTKLEADGYTDIISNIADMNATFGTNVQVNDINKTLQYTLHANIIGVKEAFGDIVNDENLTFVKPSFIRADITGDIQNIDANFTLKGGEVAYAQYNIRPQTVHVTSRYDIKEAKVRANVQSDIKANMADFDLLMDTSVDLDDINHTLKLNLKSNLLPKKPFISKILSEQNITLQELPALHIDVTTDKDNILVADVVIDPAAFEIDGLEIASKETNSNVRFNTDSQKLDFKILVQIISNAADLNLDANASSNLTDLKNTLQYAALIKLHQKEVVRDINLTQLGMITLDTQGSLKQIRAKLRSKKVKADIKSADFDKFSVFLDTQKLYLDKLYLAMPPELQKSYAALEAKGYYMLQSEKGDINLRLKTFKFADRYIKTNNFRVQLDGKDFSLSPVKLQSKGFLLSFQAKSKKGKVEAHLYNRAVKGDLKFSKEPLFADAKLDIPSIKKLLYEINKIYPLDEIPKVDGPLYAKAAMAGKQRVKVEINSPKIVLQNGNIQKLDILAFYTSKRIDIPTFQFDLRGFKPKKMNRDIRLVYPAYIAMDGQKVKVDFSLKNFLSFKAEKKDDLLHGELNTNKLFLGLEGYGRTKLTSRIHLYQSNKQLAVSGDIELEETEITYESRVMDVSQDPDIIIIKKKKKKRSVDNNFNKNTFLDLHIKSKDQIEYKVEAGTVVVRPDIEIRKDFGSKVKLLGKINILEGEYDLGDKRFQIKEGAIAFRGLEEINPHLDIHVAYEIEDVIIYIDILGDKRKPKLQFKSKPMMSKKDIFSYLLFGFAVSESEGAQSSAANAAEKIFGRALAKDLARELKLDRLDLTRNELGGIDIKAGKKAGKKTIIYYQNKALQSSVIIERKLGKHFELDVEAGQASQAVDLIYKKGFK